MNSDFLEMNMYLDEMSDEEIVDLWVTCRDRSMLVFHDVRSNPVRYEGSWVIEHDFTHVGRATSYIPAEEVWYFTVVTREIPEQAAQ